MARTFAQRMADAAKKDALDGVTTTEHLLALILIELMETRGHRLTVELARTLQRAGFSKGQAAAILDTTPAVLSVVAGRSERPPAAGAVDPVDGESTS